VVFYLGRAAADDFGEVLLILSGNGRGIGAYKILKPEDVLPEVRRVVNDAVAGLTKSA
jgi:hypothetical protein